MNGERARLVVFAGLPGVGKSTLAREVATALRATFLRIDTVEAAIASTLTAFDDSPVGYVVGARVAADQLRAGRPVVVDAVNAVQVARQGWVDLAREHAAALDFVEVTCGDPAEHRRRVEGRVAEMPGQHVPMWAEVQRRRWEPFTVDRIVIDNRGDTAASVRRVLDGLTG
ncbi:putative kinase [Pseudonocardia sediminis]|uniref:Putative kinase n=1 Tax=Pseudonocardia sediminis TaxID=1397368 RepID=A0A4Q7V1Q2_PSEST|nr:ATP-binding protein [Pseudonocardia sediminis]RZT87394.1 putative kinase [Pseudonocardia sediminis]